MNLLSMPQAAARLGCKPSHIYTLMAKGHLRRFDISTVSHRTKWRVSDEDVTAYIERMQRPVTATVPRPRARSGAA